MNDVIDMQGAPVAIPQPPSRAVAAANPAYLLQLAVEQGADIEKLEKLMALQDRWEATNARKAYVAAMAEFKKNAPTIEKDKTVSFPGTSYTHATLGNICQVVIASLASHGLSHRWSTDQPDSGMIVVDCILTHSLGHSESTTMKAPPDNSGKKNAIQQIASTVTYLQRYTLLAACGLATMDSDEDDDGRGASEPVEAKKVPPVKTAISGGRWQGALNAVRNDGYPPATVRRNFTLTVDQETQLDDAAAEATTKVPG